MLWVDGLCECWRAQRSCRRRRRRHSGFGRGPPWSLAGEHKVLDAVEERAIRQFVLGHRLCALGLAGQLWSRAEAGDLIAKSYQVRLTEQGVGRYLRR
ncbi:winged helix-turn-helix domain-containing protein [Streptomyces olivaceus]|uniref:winged helix-turn-helix domain-containing protein n=1 Tax=Streptomyces olivaceus TaxID=47716 RepID=UPI001CCE9F87|nr:winged helix-turn-helix domain-containing protein [Streptomyces olivaceus]